MDTTLSNERRLGRMDGTDCALFGLPREIRDAIYHYCFEDGYYEFTYDELNVTVLLGLPKLDNSFQNLPPWLLTCYQLLHEGLWYFFKYTTGKGYTSSPALERDIPLLPLQRGFQPFTNPLPMLRKVEITSRYYTEELIVQKGSHYAPNLITVDSRSNLWLFIQYLQTTKPLLKDFTLRLRLPDDIAVTESPGDWTVDLTHLFTLPQGLDRVEFVIEEPSLDPRYPEIIRQTAIAYLAVQRSLEFAACTLVCAAQAHDNDALPHGILIRYWLHESCIDEDEAVEHNWHVECRKTSRAGRLGQLNYGGLRCWSDRLNLLVGHHYQRYASEPSERTMWFSQKAQNGIPIDSIPSLQESCGTPRRRQNTTDDMQTAHFYFDNV
ncbi:hypothetical protein EJ04DRAFT_566456 [Polyplosphaeria fusca]|uniref:Uncharacterized protein n=1 Tax=Polyplosphaeria fusca TaxID=682080 RepID=A0A9P4QQI6_9PLEO|nr:hypothetical protein EJ04DRAFT_566456 [Polyplosphaeria fusca]